MVGIGAKGSEKSVCAPPEIGVGEFQGVRGVNGDQVDFEIFPSPQGCLVEGGGDNGNTVTGGIQRRRFSKNPEIEMQVAERYHAYVHRLIQGRGRKRRGFQIVTGCGSGLGKYMPKPGRSCPGERREATFKGPRERDPDFH